MRAKTARKLRQISLAPYPDLRQDMKDRISVLQQERDVIVRDAQKEIRDAISSFENRRRRVIVDVENKARRRQSTKEKGS